MCAEFHLLKYLICFERTLPPFNLNELIIQNAILIFLFHFNISKTVEDFHFNLIDCQLRFWDSKYFVLSIIMYYDSYNLIWLLTYSFAPSQIVVRFNIINNLKFTTKYIILNWVGLRASQLRA